MKNYDHVRPISTYRAETRSEITITKQITRTTDKNVRTITSWSLNTRKAKTKEKYEIRFKT